MNSLITFVSVSALTPVCECQKVIVTGEEMLTLSTALPPPGLKP